MKHTKDITKGIILVSIGAASYGLLATIAKTANINGFSTAEVVIAQVTLGFLGIFILNLFRKKQQQKIGTKERIKLWGFGTSITLTSTFYYLSIVYIPVSIAIILLMQTIWMGVVYEVLFQKKKLSRIKLLAMLLVLFGTVLAANLTNVKDLSPYGLALGILAAFSFTVTIYATNTISTQLPALQKTKEMLFGAWIIALIIWVPQLTASFHPSIFWTYGLALALFGTILPPLLFSQGMPKIGMGLGSILSSLEIPVSVICAAYFLQEPVNGLQIIGIICILVAVVVMNINGKEKTDTH